MNKRVWLVPTVLNVAGREIRGLDPKIRPIVELMRKHGVETYESCDGGKGHSYPEPTIRFYGQRDEGFRVLALVMQHGLPVDALRRLWNVIDGEPVGPDWEMTFRLGI